MARTAIVSCAILEEAGLAGVQHKFDHNNIIDVFSCLFPTKPAGYLGAQVSMALPLTIPHLFHHSWYRSPSFPLNHHF